MQTLPSPAPLRDIRFDSLRGLMLLSMAVNHLPSQLRSITDQSLGIFSSAEGFVFLSGLLAGYVYTRRRRRDGTAGLRAAAWRRARMIYGWHLLAYFGSLALIVLHAWILGLQSPTSPRLFLEHPWQAAMLGPLLLYQPGLLDILPMYCLFVLLLPLVLDALENGRLGWVIFPSFALWLLAQFLPNYNGAAFSPPLNFGFFNVLAWQFLFIAGVVIGHARLAATTSLVPARPALVIAAGAAAAFFFCIQHGYIHSLWPDKVFGIMLNKPSLGALRLGSFAIAAYLVAVAGARFPRLLAWRPLAMLGRHSLVVVAVQCVLVLALLSHDGFFETAGGRWVVTIVTIAAIFAVGAFADRVKPQPAPNREKENFPSRSSAFSAVR